MRIKGAFVVLSAEREGLSAATNQTRTNLLRMDIEAAGFPALPVIGRYKGTNEVAFVVPVSTQDDIDELFDLSRKYDQESILHVSPKRRATLLYWNSSKTVYIGRWCEVSADEARNLDAYTEVGGRFYAAQ